MGRGGGAQRTKSRKQNTDSESDKTVEESGVRLIIAWLLGAICVRSGRKSESLFTDFTPQVCTTRPVVRARENDGRCRVVCRLLDSERTLGANGSPPLPGVVVVGGVSTLYRRAIKTSSGFVRGVFPLVACPAAVWRGSDGVEEPFGLVCLTLCCSSLPSPICSGNQAPRCRERGGLGEEGGVCV